MIKRWIFCFLCLCISVVHATFNEVYVVSGEAELYCKVMGKGDPLIVIHGGPGANHNYLLPQLASLADDHLVVFYDQRGCGQSLGEIDKETITLSNFMHDIEDIRRAFNFDKISLYGHSWGGFLAMHYAIAYPEVVEKLILSNPVAASSEERSLFLEEYKHRTAPYQAELSRIRATQEFQAGDPETVERYFRIHFRSYFYCQDKVDLLNLQTPRSCSLNGAKIHRWVEENIYGSPYNLHAELKTLNIPTLVIHGDFDPIPAITAQRIHESIPGSKYVLLKGCGHFPFVERQEEYLNCLRGFLNFTFIEP